jgi:hypothetical protein
MNGAAACARASNPFSTRFVRPGAIAYLFAPGTSAVELVARFAACGWRGQIIGPHGSGKSTLVASLAEPLALVGRRLWTVALRDGARRMHAGWAREAQAAGAGVIAVDGYEQLGAAARIALGVRCRRRGWGLLVTAHHDAGLPTLAATSSSLKTVQTLAAGLQSGCGAPLGGEVVAECFAAAGNVRETLFRLYDRWELQSRAGRA